MSRFSQSVDPRRFVRRERSLENLLWGAFFGCAAILASCGGSHPGSEEDASFDGATGPKLEVSVAAVDFGLVDCGGTPPNVQTIRIQNSGSEALTVTAMLSDASFFGLLGSTSGSLAPGATRTFTISAKAVSSTAQAGVPIQAALHLLTNDPVHSDVEIPISLTPAGATLTLMPQEASFGETSVNVAATPIPLLLRNTGNRAVTVGFGPPSDEAFSISYQGEGSVSVLPGGSVPSLAAHFTPVNTTPASGSAALTVSGAVCGSSVSSIPFSGRGTVGAVVISGDLDFGNNPCGGAAGQAQTVMLGNTGDGAFTYTATLGKGANSPFSLSQSTGTVNPDGNVSITVTPAPIPSQVPSVPGDFGDAITITTNIPGDSPHIVTLAQGARGAVLAFDASNIDFGDVPVGESTNATMRVVNSGNSPATVTLSTTAPFGISPSSSFAVAGGTEQGAVALFTPTSNTPQTGTLSMAVALTDVLCQPLPSPVTLSGTGQSGGLSISTTSIDFGSIACGTTAAPQSLTLTNTGNASLTWTATLGRTPSPYGISSGSGTLAPSESATIDVTPAPIPATSPVTPDYYADTVTITTDVPGDVPREVELHQTARGAVLSFSPSTLDFGSVPVNNQTTGVFQIENTGNAPVNVALSSSTALFSLPNAVNVSAGTPTSVTATFAPGMNVGPQTGSFTVTTDDALCSPLPAPLTATGTGTNGIVAYTPSSLNFGNTDCGTAGAAQQVVFTNPGNQAYTITSLALARGASSPFTVSMTPSSGVVPANNSGSVTVTVTPLPIPATSAVPGNYSDSLSVTTNAVGDSPHDIVLTQNSRGAILAISTRNINFGSVRINSQGTFQLAVDNSGNAPASVQFTNSTNPVFTFDQNQTVAGGAAIVPNAYFTPMSVGVVTGTANMSVPAGTVLCQPLPGNLSLRGRGINGATVSVSPTVLTWGRQFCGTQPPSQTVTISNQGISPVDWSASMISDPLPAPGHYIVMPSSGSIPAGGAVTVTVTPRIIDEAITMAANGYNGVLEIVTDDPNTSNGPGDTNTTIQLREGARGPYLFFTTASPLNVPANQSRNFGLRNTGNVATDVDFTLAVSGGAMLSVSPNTITVPTGTTRNGTITRTGSAAGTAVLSVTNTQTLCSQVPTLNINAP